MGNQFKLFRNSKKHYDFLPTRMTLSLVMKCLGFLISNQEGVQGHVNLLILKMSIDQIKKKLSILLRQQKTKFLSHHLIYLKIIVAVVVLKNVKKISKQI